MLWIPQRRLLFVHNPKCAGSAIHRALLTTYPAAKKYWGRFYSSDLDQIFDLTHLTIHEALRVIGLRPPWRSFGFVRHPYRRFVSAYLHLTSNNPSFEALSMEELAFDVLDEERIRFDWKFIHFAPQYRFFFGKALEVDHLWRVEDLPLAWDEVRSVFAVTRGLDWVNVGPDRPQEPLSERLKARLTFLYARDFKLLHYDPAASDLSAGQNSRPLYADYAAMWPEWRDLDAGDFYRR